MTDLHTCFKVFRIRVWSCRRFIGSRHNSRFTRELKYVDPTYPFFLPMPGLVRNCPSPSSHHPTILLIALRRHKLEDTTIPIKDTHPQRVIFLVCLFLKSVASPKIPNAPVNAIEIAFQAVTKSICFRPAKKYAISSFGKTLYHVTVLFISSSETPSACLPITTTVEERYAVKPYCSRTAVRYSDARNIRGTRVRMKRIAGDIPNFVEVQTYDDILRKMRQIVELKEG